MDIKRKIYQKLFDWKNTANGSKALLIEGARRIGKSTIAEEFATYMGEELLLEYIRECFEKKVPLERSFHQKALRLFKEYILVGGMPQAVVAYKEGGRDFALADIEKRDILNLYRDEI